MWLIQNQKIIHQQPHETKTCRSIIGRPAGSLCLARPRHNAVPEETIKLLKGLKYQQGEIDLRGGLAKLTVPKEFNFLGPDDAKTVLVKLWATRPPVRSRSAC
ncbi:MAG: DUF2167 domain-containing protein [Limisphaerales bacterium]